VYKPHVTSSVVHPNFRIKALRLFNDPRGLLNHFTFCDVIYNVHMIMSLIISYVNVKKISYYTTTTTTTL